MSMTPFELRFNLLNFARDSLTSEYFAKVEEAKSFPVNGRLLMPKYPTKEDVFALAEEYKHFIERK